MANTTNNVNPGIFNQYTISPNPSLTQYKAFRGVTDFTQIGQFNQYESGYQFLSVISIPKFMEKLGDSSPMIKNMNTAFKHMLEYEFRGLDGLPDIQSDTMTITDGINEQRMINKVTMDTAITVSSNYFEKSGSLITKYSEYYLTGIKDRMTQAKTYHGLIKNNILEPNFENEVFTLLYYVTDSTMLRLERAILLANCQLTKADTSNYNGSRDNISNKEMTIEFNAFPIYGVEVDKAANYMLRNISGVGVTSSIDDKSVSYNSKVKVNGPTAVFDSNDYRYGILGGHDYNSSAEGKRNISPTVSTVGTKDLVNAIDAIDKEDSSTRTAN